MYSLWQAGGVLRGGFALSASHLRGRLVWEFGAASADKLTNHFGGVLLCRHFVDSAENEGAANSYMPVPTHAECRRSAVAGSIQNAVLRYETFNEQNSMS